MLATNVDVSNITYIARKGLYEGRVRIEIQSECGARTHVVFLCSASLPSISLEPVIIRSLIGDALRQARSMPGFLHPRLTGGAIPYPAPVAAA